MQRPTEPDTRAASECDFTAANSTGPVCDPEDKVGATRRFC